MTQYTFKLSQLELRELLSLAGDQLFRREFIDPKMPGFRARPGQLQMGKQLLQRLRILEATPPGARSRSRSSGTQ